MLHKNYYVTFKKGIDFFSFCYKSFILLIQHFQVILQLLFLFPHREAFTPATLCYFGVEFFFYYNSIFAMFFYYDTRTVQKKHFFLICQVQCFISFISFICRIYIIGYNNSFTQAIRQLFVLRIITFTFYMEKNCAIVVLYVYFCILKLLFSYYTFYSIFLNKAINSSNSIFHFLSIIKNAYKAYSIENH